MSDVEKAEQKSEDIVAMVRRGQKVLEDLSKAELLEYSRRMERDAWYQRAVRPMVTMIVVMAFCVVVVYRSMWGDDQNAFEAMLMAFGSVVGFWFAGRQYQKTAGK